MLCGTWCSVVSIYALPLCRCVEEEDGAEGGAGAGAGVEDEDEDEGEVCSNGGGPGCDSELLIAGLDSLRSRSPRFSAGDVVVRAARPLAAGEEFTLSYLPEEAEQLPTKERRRILSGRYGFQCECERCRVGF